MDSEIHNWMYYYKKQKKTYGCAGYLLLVNCIIKPFFNIQLRLKIRYLTYFILREFSLFSCITHLCADSIRQN